MNLVLKAARVAVCVTVQGLVAQEVAFVDVSVVPMDSERILHHHTVLVKGDRITAIGPAAQLRVPSSSIRVDGRGKFLIPGLADMHVHFFMGSMRTVTPLLLAANGVTTARSMSGSPEVLSLKKEIEEGQLVGPRIYSSGSVTDGNPPAYPGSRVVVTANQAKQAVEQDKSNGYGAVKVLTRLTPSAYGALVREAREHGMEVWGHVPDLVGLVQVLSDRQKSIEHLYGYIQALHREPSPAPGLLSSSDRYAAAQMVDMSKLPSIVNATVQAGTWNCPTLTHQQNRSFPLGQAEQKLKEPHMRYLPADLLKDWTARSGKGSSVSKADLANMHTFWSIGLEITRALHQKGARLLIGTDTPNPLTVPGYSVHEELQQFVLAGLTPFEAIVAAHVTRLSFLASRPTPGQSKSVRRPTWYF
jgi:imidazolonepropionase-like amidohydrolase